MLNTSLPSPEVCHGHSENRYSILDRVDDQHNRILKAVRHSEAIVELHVFAPSIARFGLPGQFIVVRVDEQSERIPLTIADVDEQLGTLIMVIQDVGVSSHAICCLQEGQRFLDIVGPLGHASDIQNFGTVVCVGGGLGIAPVYPIQQALKEAGNHVISIMGARNESLLFWQEQMKACADELHIVTDDGSAGEQGFVTTVLEKMIADGVKIDRVIAIGPPIMMRAVAESTRPHNIPTIASLNTVMVDGTGMCGGCRVLIGEDTKFTCVDGPEFNAHLVDWDMFFSRLGTYTEQEGKANKKAAHPNKKRIAKRRKQRVPMPHQDASFRASNFDEVAIGYTPAMAVIEAERCLQCKKPHCVDGCPVGIDIPGFLDYIVKGDFSGSAEHLKQFNKLPAICGRVCPQETQCEELCVVGIKNEPVAIGRLERFVADYQMSHDDTPAQASSTKEKRVAVIGGGPAGITAAAELAYLGFKVSIFEALHTLGGVLMYGIPEFRLPKDIVQKEIQQLNELGVDIRLNQPIGTAITVPYLLEEGYDAVFIGTGAGLPTFPSIPGENLKNVYSANEFLTRINLMKAYDQSHHTPVLGARHTAVVGGGNVAMDAARSALRLGAEEVSIIYRRTREQMPARLEEVEHAIEEGVSVIELCSPLEIVGGDDGQVAGLRCQNMELGEPDDSGRRRPVAIEGSERLLDVDQIVFAIGQGPNPMLTKTWPDLQLTKWGNIVTDDIGMTNVPGVFAGGDIVTGAATVIEAMGAGKTAALSIAEWLDKQD